MPASSTWPIVCLLGEQTWIWRLRGGNLLGSSMDRHEVLDLGPVHAFDGGYSQDGEMFLLVERAHDDARVNLEIVRPGESRPHRVDSLGSVAAPAFSHCLPPIDARSDWTPGWLDGRVIRHGEGCITLPEPLAEVSALMPSGEAGNWPWVFTGVSREGAGITGVISRRWGWEPWVATPGLCVMAPGYLPREGELWFLVSHRRGMHGDILAGRRWRKRAGTVRGLTWEPPRPLLALGQTGGEGFGGVVGCHESPGFFWVSRDDSVCRWGVLPPRPDSRARECIVLSEQDGRVLPRPVRYRARACPAARGRVPCHTTGLGVVTHRYVAPLMPDPCPLLRGYRPGHSEQRTAGTDASHGHDRIARLRRALGLALLEVESLRRERSRLQTELESTVSSPDTSSDRG